MKLLDKDTLVPWHESYLKWQWMMIPSSSMSSESVGVIFTNWMSTSRSALLGASWIICVAMYILHVKLIIIFYVMKYFQIEADNQVRVVKQFTDNEETTPILIMTYWSIFYDEHLSSHHTNLKMARIFYIFISIQRLYVVWHHWKPQTGALI